MAIKELKEEDIEFSNWMRNFYNKKASKISDKGYEYARWFSTREKRRQHKFSTISILHHLRDIEFKNCLEIGCGPGTWTELLIKKYPDAKFTCLDISKEMIKQFKDKIKSKNVKTLVNSFLDQEFKEKFDFIFCSRAIEYIPNKSAVLNKIESLLNPRGRAIIITSPPHPTAFAIKKIIKGRVNKQHTQRISVKIMDYLLKRNNFAKIRFYPILFSDFALVPTETLFYSLYKKRWGLLSKLFATGYLVKFEKVKDEKN